MSVYLLYYVDGKELLSCREMWEKSEGAEQTITCNFNSKGRLFVQSLSNFLVMDCTSLGRQDTHKWLAAC